jgi:hypothetical protein
MKNYKESDCSYCTLFNSFYLGRGITMIRSLISVSGDIRIYVLAMDDNTFDILSEQSFEKVYLIHHDDFATEELLTLKKQRTVAEYCWTCTAQLIEYVFENYREQICTYIDADLFFYQNPFCLIEEMIKKKCSIQIVEHRFGRGIFANHMRRYSGVFCVQFNTFENTDEARRVLKEWGCQCIEYCSSEQDGMTLGDQKYLEDWPEKYKCVNILENEGGGVAPWNIHKYKGKSYYTSGIINIEDRYSKKIYPLIFYHFHGLELRRDGMADIGVFARNFGIDKKLVVSIYGPYIEKVRKEEEYLDERLEILRKESYKNKNIIKKTVKKTVKEKIFSENLGERIYCRVRAAFMKSRRKKDLM